MTALFLLALLVTGCKKNNDPVGLGLQPEELILGINQTDTVTVQSATVREDSLRADELSQSLIGADFDLFTGQSNASFYTQLRLSTPDIDFGENPVADSLVLSFKYTGDFWGVISNQNFEVLRMTEGFEVDSAYYTNQDFETENTNLIEPGWQTQRFNFAESIVTEEDSVGPQLRFRLAQSLADELINLGPEVYDTNDDWLEYFKGLYVRSTSNSGGIAHLDLVDGESVMRLHYHNDSDTTFFDFVINSVTGRVNHYEHIPGGHLNTLSSDEAVDGSIINYVKAGSGYKTKISFPFIDELNKIEGRTINKAELVLPVADPYDIRFPYQSLLFVLTEDEDGNPVGLPGQVSSIVSIGGNYEALDNQYRFNITRWLQSYLNGDQAVDFIHLVSNNGSISAKTVRINGPEASGSDESENMRLIVTYSN